MKGITLLIASAGLMTLASCSTMPCQFGTEAECLQHVRQVNPSALPPAPRPEPSENDLIARYGVNHVNAWKAANHTYAQCITDFQLAHPDEVALYAGNMSATDPTALRLWSQVEQPRLDAMNAKCGASPPSVDSPSYGTD